MRMSRLPSLALVTIAAIAFQAAAPAVSAAPDDAIKVEVRIDNFTFSLAVITVKPGTQITWTRPAGTA
jgi:plastocyanin